MRCTSKWPHAVCAVDSSASEPSLLGDVLVGAAACLVPGRVGFDGHSGRLERARVGAAPSTGTAGAGRAMTGSDAPQVELCPSGPMLVRGATGDPR